MSWPNDSSTLEEEDKEQEEEEQEEGEEREEVDSKPLIMDVELEQGKEDQEGKQGPSRWHSQDWETVMGEEERLDFDDPWSDSDATADGRSPRHPTQCELESPMEAVVEVHAWESEVEDH